MPSKKAKAAIAEVKSKFRNWTFETSGELVPNGVSNFIGKLKDENGKVIMSIREDEDYNQLSHLLLTSKHMRREDDMKGLAAYVWDRNLLPFENDDEKDEWKQKKVIPLDIRHVKVI